LFKIILNSIEVLYEGLDMFGIKNFSERSAADRLLEEKLYEQVAQDLAQGKRREGIWAKRHLLTL